MIRATRWVPAIAAVVAVTACGQTVPGAPAAEPGAARQAADRMFEKNLQALGEYVSSAKDFRGTVFRYAAINDKSSGSEVEVSMEGDPHVLMTRIRSTSHPGFDYDIYHPAGNALDFVKLGPGYAKLAPTPWVSMATSTSSGYRCAMPGLQTLCKIGQAIEATAKAAPPDLTKSAGGLDDGGTEARAAITLKSFLDAAVIPIPVDVTAKIEPDMMGKLVPIKIIVNRDDTLRKVEINGELLSRDDKIQLQVGYEARGPAASSDFPPVPQPGEVTALPDKTAVDDFWARLSQIRG